MDEKILGYLIANCKATDKCLDCVETLMSTTIKQARINRCQRLMNIILAGLTVSCVCNIADLIKVVKHQNTRIEALEKKLNGEESEEKKGE
jgi:hypothetical protein